MRNCQGGPQKVARNSIEQSFNKVRKRCNSNDLNSMFEIVAGELRAKLGAVSAMPQVRSGHDTCAAARPGRASRRRAQPPISHHAPLLWRAPEGPEGTGGLRDRPLRAKLACGDLAGDRARRRPQPSGTTSKHAAAPPERRSRPGAGGRRQGLAGLRDDAPSHRSATMRHCCGGRRRVRRARAGFEIDRSERSSRAAISRAAGPDGARNTSVTTSSHATQTHGSPSGPPRVHATSSYSTPSRGRAFSAVAQPRPRRPGPR